MAPSYNVCSMWNFKGSYVQSQKRGTIEGELAISNQGVIMGNGRDANSSQRDRRIVGLLSRDHLKHKRILQLLFIVPGGRHCDVLYRLSAGGVEQELQGRYQGTWCAATHFGDGSFVSGPHETWRAEEFYIYSMPQEVPRSRRESPARLELMTTGTKKRAELPNPWRVLSLLERCMTKGYGDNCGGETDTHIR